MVHYDNNNPQKRILILLLLPHGMLQHDAVRPKNTKTDVVGDPHNVWRETA